MSHTDHISPRPRPTALPVLKRVQLPQRLRDDAWWLCPAPARPAARVLPFRRPAPATRPEGRRHD